MMKVVAHVTAVSRYVTKSVFCKYEIGQKFNHFVTTISSFQYTLCLFITFPIPYSLVLLLIFL